MIRVVIRAVGDPADDGEAEHKPDLSERDDPDTARIETAVVHRLEHWQTIRHNKPPEDHRPLATSWT